MTNNEESSVRDYLTRYTAYVDNRLHVLERHVAALIRFRPVWDPLARDYIFVEPITGISHRKPVIPKSMKNKLFRWFGNQNAKRKNDVRPD